MNRTKWRENFPNVIIDRIIGEASKHKLYHSAKSGNASDAYHLASDLVTDIAIQELKKLIVHERPVLLIPVHAEEASGRNMIPLACATLIEEKLGEQVKVDLSIVQSSKVSRTGSTGWNRLANPPQFSGKIKDDIYAIMIDDNLTQGGTFAALNGYIENMGCTVLGAYALTGRKYSAQLKLSDETLCLLRTKYEELETWWTQLFKYNFEALTEWEARYLINSNKSSDFIRSKITQTKQI
jgi:hypothetical protein